MNLFTRSLVLMSELREFAKAIKPLAISSGTSVKNNSPSTRNASESLSSMTTRHCGAWLSSNCCLIVSDSTGARFVSTMSLKNSLIKDKHSSGCAIRVNLRMFVIAFLSSFFERIKTISKNKFGCKKFFNKKQTLKLWLK